MSRGFTIVASASSPTETRSVGVLADEGIRSVGVPAHGSSARRGRYGSVGALADETTRSVGVPADGSSARRGRYAVSTLVQRVRSLAFAGLIGAVSLLLSGCRTDMWVQQRVEAQDNSEFYALTDPVQGFDGKIYGDGSRPMPENTIARGKLQDPNDPFVTGKDAQGNLLTKLPPQVKLTREFLNLGQEKYNIFCAPCHGRAGDGKGMIALRGQWPRPVPSLVRDQMLQQPLGYFFTSGKYGFGIMYGYGSRMTDEELWAVAAYIRVLQLSQNANIKDLSPEDLEKLAEAEQARQRPRTEPTRNAFAPNVNRLPSDTNPLGKEDAQADNGMNPFDKRGALIDRGSVAVGKRGSRA